MPDGLRWRVAQTGTAPISAPLRTTIAHLNGEDGYPLCGRCPRLWRHRQFDAYPDDKRCLRCAVLGATRDA